MMDSGQSVGIHGATPVTELEVVMLTAKEALAVYEVLQGRVGADHDYGAYGSGWAKLRARAQEASA
jgi:hypothetical protein